ncbi:DegT/DnrJ/EryC1/StrS family aminotransferase [Iodobacter fluviatilis]|uniref:Pyridoxal-5'-phosphate-dependent protein n=1 Tax=Iodobacter fluviatilis TaxID=537 RepID=A0A7G3G7C1_9NEIS|nr:DegT/DnrJ/EryC1/StrS family aminotransferase [Iodobacter fluviatilis]QBC43126.1 pyridoxal-5'-phosphate-dependent protein [Iodobacter fluviatilis]
MLPLIKVGMPDRSKLMPMLENVLYSGMLAEGEAVYEFERRFAQHFGLDRAIAMSSGTAALHAALVLAGVNANDEVITTSMTAEPTNVVILQVGAIPVFADVDVNSGNLDPKDIERKITEKTKAIVVVHYAGIPVRLAEIAEIAKKHHIPLIEDCAHALGARYANRSIGCIGDFAIFSMQAIKHMTTVDGGILTFKDETLLRSAKKFRWFGLEKGIPRTEVDINSVGYKYNMHNVAATIGLAQLDVIDGLISRHISNGRYFDEHISKIPGLSVPFFDEVASPSYWLYTIFSDDSSNIEKLLSNIGVAANKLHRPNHYHSIFKPFAGVLPELEKYYQNMIHIPCGWWVSDEDRDRIVNALQRG